MTYTVADALLDQLADHGVRICFGVPGVHNLALWAGAGVGRRPRVVGVRHEQAAGYAADAGARATGSIGVALTTTGPGFANALAAFGEAWASFSPMVLISSETPIAPRRTSGHDDGLLHGMRSQADMITHGFGALAVSAHDGAQALAALPRLVAHAIASGRPVYLGVPADVLSAPWAGVVPEPTPLEHWTNDSARRAAKLVAGKRVVLWLGARALASELSITSLASELNAVVVTTYQARGMLAAHPGLLDAPPHEPRVAAVIGEADVLLVIGDDLHGMTTRNWSMPVPGTIVAITDQPDASLGDYELGARLVGHIGSCVEALREALHEHVAAEPFDVAAVRRGVMDDLAADARTGPARAFLRSVDDGWPDAGALVVDMCIAGYWLGGYSRQSRPRRLQYPVGWGTLGWALPAAIGPAAHGIPTLAVVGDGGAAMAIGELATYAQERLPIALLVVTDGGYGMLRYDQTVAGDPHHGVDLVEPRWEDLASAYDMRVARTDDPGAGLARALTQAREGLACGERWMVVLEAAFLPPRTTSPRWREA